MNNQCLEKRVRHCGKMECHFHLERSLYNMLVDTDWINDISYLSKSVNNRGKTKTPLLVTCGKCNKQTEFKGQKKFVCECNEAKDTTVADQINVSDETDQISVPDDGQINRRKQVLDKETIYRLFNIGGKAFTFLPEDDDNYFVNITPKKTIWASCSECDCRQRVYADVFVYMFVNGENCPFTCNKRNTDKNITISVENIVTGSRRRK